MLELEYEFLCEFIAIKDTTQIIGPGPYGVRRIVPIKGGTVTGPKLKGQVLPCSADWIRVRSDGTWELDVRATIQTDDGELIYLSYRGILTGSAEIMERFSNGEEVDPSELYLRTTPIFETGSEKYRWLNHIITVGVGATNPIQVRYKIYQVL